MHGKPPIQLARIESEVKVFLFFRKKVGVFRAVLGFLFGQIIKETSPTLESGNRHLLWTDSFKGIAPKPWGKVVVAFAFTQPKFGHFHASVNLATFM